MKLESDITFGDKYRDSNTGFEGTAVAVYFYQYGCTRVTLVGLHEGDVKDYTFDEQSLESVKTGKPIETKSPAGGSRPGPSALSARR